MKKFLQAFTIASIILFFIYDTIDYSFKQKQVYYLNEHKISYFEYRFPTVYYLLQPSKKTNRYYTRLIKDGIEGYIFDNSNSKISSLIRALQNKNKNLDDYLEELLYFWNKELAPNNKIKSKQELEYRLYCYDRSHKYKQYLKHTQTLHRNKTIMDQHDNQNKLYLTDTLDTVEQFIKNIDINHRDSNHTTPLMHFINQYNRTAILKQEQEYFKIIELLLEKGSDTRGALSQVRDLKVLKLVLKYGGDINEEDRYKRNLLYYTNTHEFAQFLIKHHIDINRHDIKQQTPLMYLLQQYDKTQNIQYKKIVQVLLKNGVDTHNAAFYTNDLEMIKLLFENGVNINETKDRTDSITLLMHHQNNKPIRNYLLAQGIDITKTNNGKTILHSVQNIELIEYLLEKGLKLTGYSSIHVRWKSLFSLLDRYHKNQGKSKERYFKVIKKLLDSANINAVGRLNQNLLFYTDDYQLVQYLIDRGINLNHKNRHDKTALDIFLNKYPMRQTINDYKIITTLIKNGAKSRNSPQLMFYDSLEDVKKIVESGDKYNKKYNHMYFYNHKRYFYVDFYIQRYLETKEQKYLDISYYLIKKGARPKVDTLEDDTIKVLLTHDKEKIFYNYLKSYLHLLVSRNIFDLGFGIEGDIFTLEKILKHNIDTSGLLFETHNTQAGKLLIKYGANINEKNKAGDTPLLHHLRSKRYSPDFINWLIKEGADVLLKDVSGKRAIDYMAQYLGMTSLAIQKQIDAKKFTMKHIQRNHKIQNNTIEFNLSGGMTSIVNEKAKPILPKQIPSEYNLSATNIHKIIFDSHDFIQSLYKKSEKQSNNIEPKKVKPTPTPKPKEPKSLIDCYTLEEVQKAINNGVNIENRIYDWMRPFIFFITGYHKSKDKKYFEIAQYLYNQGAKATIDTVGLDSVQQIVKYDNHKQFIKAAHKDSPLHESSLKHIKALLQNDFNTSGLLFMTESDEITKLLIMHGADVNEKDKHGLTPILYHLRYGHGMTNINLLVEYGADLYVVDELGNAPIDYIAKRKRITPLEVQKQVASGKFTMFTYVKYHKPEPIKMQLGHNLSHYDIYRHDLLDERILGYIPKFQMKSGEELEQEIFDLLHRKDKREKKCNTPDSVGMTSIVNECGAFFR